MLKRNYGYRIKRPLHSHCVRNSFGPSLSIYPPAYLPIYMSLCASISLSFSLSDCLSNAGVSFHRPVSMSQTDTHTHTHTHTYIYIYIYSPILSIVVKIQDTFSSSDVCIFSLYLVFCLYRRPFLPFSSSSHLALFMTFPDMKKG